MAADIPVWFKLLEFFKSSLRAMIVLFTFSLLALLLPLIPGVPKILVQWRERYLPWFLASAIITGLWILTFPVEIAAKHCIEYRKIARRLSDLAGDEKRFLLRFFQSNTSVVIAWPHEMGKLEVDGILFRPSDSGFGNNQFNYSLTPRASKYVSRHKDSFLQYLKK